VSGQTDPAAGLPAVDFHSGVGDKLAYTCRLLRKACRSGQRVFVLGTPLELARLDQLLWVFEPGEFIAHVRLAGPQPPPEHLQRSPVWLGTNLQAMQAGQVVVNLGPEPVDDPQRCARLIEVVAQDEVEVASGRARWRHYKAAGLDLRNHQQDGR